MNSSLALHAAADYEVFQHTFSTANSVGRRIGMRATASGCAFAGRQRDTHDYPPSADLLLLMTFAGVFDVDSRLICSEVEGDGLSGGRDPR
jgi:hypothetical protein